MNKSKHLGFLAVGLGVLIAVSAAVLPVATGPQAKAPLYFVRGGGDCGPAAWAAMRPAQGQCRDEARHRLAVTTSAGLALILVGVTLLVGADDGPGSSVVVTRWRLVRSRRRRRGRSRRHQGGHPAATG